MTHGNLVVMAVLLLIYFCNVVPLGEGKIAGTIRNDFLDANQLWRGNDGGVADGYARKRIVTRMIRSPDNRKEPTKKIIPEEDYDDGEGAELQGFDYDGEKGKVGQFGNLNVLKGNDQTSLKENDDEAAELGPQTIEDLDELETFYSNTKQNIMRTHRSRILEGRTANKLQVKKDTRPRK